MGAIFLSTPFPEFVAHSMPPLRTPIPLSSRNYAENMGLSSPTSYGSVPRNTQRHTTSHRHPQLPSPTDQTLPDNKQDQYRYIMPRPTMYPTYPTSAPPAAGPSWPVVKNEEESNLTTAYIPSHRTSHGQSSQYRQ